MAILEKVKGVTVKVLVDGVALPEYSDEEDNENTTPSRVTKYIESKTGSQFVVECRVNTKSSLRTKSVSVHLHIDGKWVGGWIESRKRMKQASKFVFQGPDDQPELKFTFAPLSIGEHLASNELAKPGGGHVKIKDLGWISLRVHLVKLGRRKLKKTKVTERTGPSEKGSFNLGTNPVTKTPSKVGGGFLKLPEQESAFTVSEKVVKGRAISHTVSFSKAQPVRPEQQSSVTERKPTLDSDLPEDGLLAASSKLGSGIESKAKTKPKPVYTRDYTYVHGQEFPHAQYDFKYCSIESLKALRLIPHTPSQDPSQVEDPADAFRPIEELSPEEILEELRSFREERQRNKMLALMVKAEDKIKVEETEFRSNRVHPTTDAGAVILDGNDTSDGDEDDSDEDDSDQDDSDQDDSDQDDEEDEDGGGDELEIVAERLGKRQKLMATSGALRGQVIDHAEVIDLSMDN